MTARQYHTTLLRKLHATAKQLHGWSHDDIKSYMPQWGFGGSISALSIDQLKELISIIEMGEPAAQPRGYKPRYTELMRKSMQFCEHGTAPGMATERQIKMVCILYGAYCHYRGIPIERWDETFTAWLGKYWHEQFVGWCSQTKATKIISALERQIITTHGRDVFAQVTGQDWPERGEKYQKYGGGK